MPQPISDALVRLAGSANEVFGRACAPVLTRGALANSLVHATLQAYNQPLAEARLPACTTEQFTAWTQMHHILASPYRGRKRSPGEIGFCRSGNAEESRSAGD